MGQAQKRGQKTKGSLAVMELTFAAVAITGYILRRFRNAARRYSPYGRAGAQGGLSGAS